LVGREALEDQLVDQPLPGEGREVEVRLRRLRCSLKTTTETGQSTAPGHSAKSQRSFDGQHLLKVLGNVQPQLPSGGDKSGKTIDHGQKSTSEPATLCVAGMPNCLT
jgi:hypothetical protein